MKIYMHKQVTKYLRSLNEATCSRLQGAIEGLKQGSGDIIKLKGKNMYRLKIPPFRIGFTLDHENDVIEIVLIRPRGDFYKHI